MFFDVLTPQVLTIEDLRVELINTALPATGNTLADFNLLTDVYDVFN